MTEALTLVSLLLQGIEGARRQRRRGSNVVYRLTLFVGRGFNRWGYGSRGCATSYSRARCRASALCSGALIGKLSFSVATLDITTPGTEWLEVLKRFGIGRG